MRSSPSSPICPSNEKQLHTTTPEVHGVESEASPSLNDPTIEKALLRKLDLHVVVPLMFLFILAFLDRVNIANAKIQGMTKELKMAGHDYNVALLTFFPP